MASREAVVKSLAVLGATFPRDITPELVSIYHAALADVSDDALRVALGRAVQECRFFPVPAELRERCGANAKPLPNVAGIVERLRGLMSYHPSRGEQMPSVERVREACGDAIADAYGFVGPHRMEAVVLGGSGTGADIAAREFATALREAQDDGADLTLPALPPSADVSVVRYDLPPSRPAPIAGLLPAAEGGAGKGGQ